MIDEKETASRKKWSKWSKCVSKILLEWAECVLLPYQAEIKIEE